MRDCQGQPVTDHGKKVLKLSGPADVLANVRVASVARNLMSVAEVVAQGNEVVFRPSGSYIRNLKNGQRIMMRRNKGSYEVEFQLEPYDGGVAVVAPRPSRGLQSRGRRRSRS